MTPSVQLYTVRDDLARDLPGSLQRLARLGFTHVEPYRILDYPALPQALTDAGLSAPTAHADFLATDRTATFARAAELGARLVVAPYTAPENWTSRDGIDRVAEQLNAAAGSASSFGLTIGYHNHAHEIASTVTIDGQELPGLEYLAQNLDPVIALEVDTYWAAVGGGNPAQLLTTLGDRIQAIHVKDGPATSVKEDQVALGQGDLDIPAILAAAPHALRVIELDGTRGDVWDAIAAGLTYLNAEEPA